MQMGGARNRINRGTCGASRGEEFPLRVLGGNQTLVELIDHTENIVDRGCIPLTALLREVIEGADCGINRLAELGYQMGHEIAGGAIRDRILTRQCSVPYYSIDAWLPLALLIPPA
ncbi:hypothetical protein SAMN04489793_0034 [Tsukamurella tyrosinosolvens]|uniref:Uncharacterized protein n=1 Tax=Tsukamurella tyrosinosolvens TaxID=57704 RepID=A0A1H4I6M8_TSUTY|nr:hypothetical protein SAMN04489793_0034 [Tsukamurella tyrosinosolvens]